jgi:hypothetical protein
MNPLKFIRSLFRIYVEKEMEIYRLTDNLFQSSSFSKKDVVTLALLGVDLVIDLEGGFDPELGFLESYLYWPIEDKNFLPDIDQLRLVSKYGLGFLNLNKKVLTHCKMGCNRSSLVNGCMLIMSGMKGPEAVDLIQSKNPNALSNKTFRNYLEIF